MAIKRLLRGKTFRKKRKFNAYFRAAQTRGFGKHFSKESALLATEPASNPYLRSQFPRRGAVARVKREELEMFESEVKFRKTMAKAKYAVRAHRQKMREDGMKKIKKALKTK